MEKWQEYADKHPEYWDLILNAPTSKKPPLSVDKFNSEFIEPAMEKLSNKIIEAFNK